MSWIESLLGRSGYLPHGYCFTWTPGLLWSMVSADAVIAFAYFSIPLAILSFVRRRKEKSPNPVAWLFCAFIFACGVTHVMDIWTIWRPDYGLQALTKIITAGISIVTAAVLWFLIPRALKIPSIGQLQVAVAGLEAEIDKRKAVEDGAFEIEQGLVVTLASIGAGFIATDVNGSITRMNEVAERVTGWPEIHAVGQSIWLVMDREGRPSDMASKNPLDVLVELGITIDLARQMVVVSQHGVRTQVEVKAALTHGRDGKVTGLAVVFRDMTPQIEAEVQASQLAAIVDSSSDAIIGKTLTGIITSWNPGAERLFGYTAGEAIGQPMQMLMPEDRLSEEPMILTRLAAGEVVEHFEAVRRRKGGQLIDVSSTISPVRNAAGIVTGASKIARDITERKQSEARLLAQLQRLRLLDQITRSIGERLDLRSVYQVTSRSVHDEMPAELSAVLVHEPGAPDLTVMSVACGTDAEVILQDRKIEIDGNGLGKSMRGELVYEEDTANVPFPFPQKLAAAGFRSLVIAPLRSESRIFGVLIAARAQPHAFSSGECEFIRQLSSHVALAAHQAQLYGSLQAAYDELRRTQQAAVQQERLRALGQMASGIAHDINNAISPAMLYAESLLEREELSERARGYVQSIAQAVEDVAATVARMREFYRARESSINLLPVWLNALADQVIELSRARWHDMPLEQGTVIEVVRDLAADLPQVLGIESEIREALINLVFNAVDAMPTGGSLTLRTRAVPADSGSPDCVAIDVIDTGSGMDDETRRRCLEPFYTTKGERGTGLGLAMVFGTMQRHGAEIGIDTEVGVGTTMSLMFPLEPIEAQRTEPTLIAGRVQPLLILLVDDDPVLLRSLRDTLEGDGHATLTANGGQDGMDAFATALADGRAPDIVITDLGMPTVDGRRVAARIKSLSPATPVILLTGWGQRMQDDGERPEHIDLVLSKPPRLADLRAGLARCLPEVP